MKVEKVNLKSYNNAPKLRVTSGFSRQPSLKGVGCDSTSFTGGIPQGDLVKDIQKYMPASLKFINKFADSMGEVSNILINAAGTGLVAPIFIKYNPLSKTDEDTRTYSAWRQPISAILAIGTQVSMVAPFNNLINNMANSGYLDEYYNKTNFQDDKYIAKLIKRENKNISKEQLAKAVEKEKTRQYNDLIENLRNKNQILIRQDKAPTTVMKKDSYENLLLGTIEDMINKDKETLKKCDTKSEKRIIRSEILRRHNENAALTLNEIDTKLKSFTTLSEYKSYLASKIKSMKAENADEELIKMVNEVLERAKYVNAAPEDEAALMKAMDEKVAKMRSHVNTYSNMLSEAEVKQHVEASVANRKTALNKSIEVLKELKSDVTSPNGTTVKNIENKIKAKLKEANLVEDCSIKSDFAKQVVEKYKSNVEGSLKGYKQYTGLIISLAVLPITCCLLNWVYPRFMDAIFPNLSNKKHDNEANALVAKAPKKEEV